MADETKAKEQDNVNPEKTGEEGVEKEDTSQPLGEDAAPEEESDGTEQQGEPEGESEDKQKDEPEGEDKLSEFFEEDKKTGVQKRIDQLTAEKKQALESNEKLQKQVDELEDKVSEKEATSMFEDNMPDYSPEQLNEATRKALEDGDHNLILEIMDYKVKKGQQNAFKTIEKRNKEMAQKQQEQAQEWQSIIDDFSDYGKEDKDLDLKNTNGVLYQLAARLFNDPEKRKRYQKGGQRQAVLDALTLIMKKRRSKNSETKDLEKRLAKERRKTNVSGSGKSVKKESQPTPKTQKGKLDEYLSEREGWSGIMK